MRLGTIVRLALVGVVALTVALVAVVKSIDVNRYRDALTQAAKAATGRQLEIRGKLSLKLSLTPALIAEDVTLSNASWGSRPVMISVQRLRADIGLLPLLVREVRLSRLTLVGPDLLLERNAAGDANWTFAAAAQPASATAAATAIEAAGTPTTFKIAQVAIEHGRVTYRDGRDGRIDAVQIDHLTIDADTLASPVGLRADGAWNERHFEISGVLGPLAQVLAPGKPYPVKLKAVLPNLVATTNGSLTIDKTMGPVLSLQATSDATDLAEAAKLVGVVLPPLGAARVALNVIGPLASPSLVNIEAVFGRRDTLALTAKGSIKTPLTGAGVDLLLFAEGENVGGLGRGFDSNLPLNGPVKGSAHLTDVDHGWHLADIKATIGRSDMNGDAMLRWQGSKPLVEARLTSSLIDLGEAATSAKAENARPRGEQGRLFSDDPLPVDLLGLADADMAWKIDRLQVNGLTSQQVTVALALQGGKLTVTPKVVSLAGGKLSATLTLDGSAGKSPPQASLTLDADRVALGDLLKALAITPAVHDARTSLHLALKGAGGSVRALMARLDGETLLVSEKGMLDGAYNDLLVFDLLRQLAPWTEQKNTQMQCLISRFSINDGMAHSEALLFDTDAMNLSGQGSINLANEVLDLTVAPKPKDASLINLALPLDIGGTLSHPTVAPNRGAIVKGAASLAGPGALGPLGALLPTMGTGTDDANPCLAAINQAKKPPPPAPAKTVTPKKIPRSELDKVLHGVLGK